MSNEHIFHNYKNPTTCQMFVYKYFLADELIYFQYEMLRFCVLLIFSRLYRHVAYRIFTRWVWGVLGRGHRIPVPACAVWAIRGSFPEEDQVHAGFYMRSPYQWFSEKTEHDAPQLAWSCLACHTFERWAGSQGPPVLVVRGVAWQGDNWDTVVSSSGLSQRAPRYTLKKKTKLCGHIYIKIICTIHVLGHNYLYKDGTDYKDMNVMDFQCITFILITVMICSL